MGIRIPFKNINKIAVRIDYAKTITPFKSDISRDVRHSLLFYPS